MFPLHRTKKSPRQIEPSPVRIPFLIGKYLSRDSVTSSGGDRNHGGPNKLGTRMFPLVRPGLSRRHDFVSFDALMQVAYGGVAFIASRRHLMLPLRRGSSSPASSTWSEAGRVKGGLRHSFIHSFPHSQSKNSYDNQKR